MLKYMMFINALKRLNINYIMNCNFCRFQNNYEKKIVIDLFSSKCKKIVYDSIFVIIDRYIKIIKYIFVTIKINVAKLTKMFFEKIVLRFDMSRDIINDKNFVFINIF